MLRKGTSTPASYSRRAMALIVSGEVPVKAGDKAGHHADTALVKRLDGFRILFGLVLGFVRILERFSPERLHSEEDPDAAGGFHQLQQALVPGDIHAGLGQPPFLQGDHAVQQFSNVGPVGGQVVVPEPDQLSLPPVLEIVVANVGQHLLHRAHAEARD